MADTLFTSQSADATSSDFAISDAKKTVTVKGVFDGAHVKFEYETIADSSDDWYQFHAVRTGPDQFVIALDAGTKIRAAVVNAGTNTSLTVILGTS